MSAESAGWARSVADPDDAARALSERGRLDALTGVRAVAALAVVLFHATQHAATFGLEMPGWLHRALRFGYLGVDLFFILSGFILAQQYLDSFKRLRPDQVARFLALRLARIHPLHVATLLLLAVAVVAATLLTGFQPDPAVYGWWPFVKHLTLIHAWGWTPVLTWNAPAWSISCEWLAYLCFPLIARGLAGRKGGPVSVVIAVALLAVMVITLRWAGLSNLDAASEGGLVRIAGEFTAGVLLFTWCRDVRAAERWAPLLESGSAVALLVLALTGHADPWAPFLFLALLAGLAFARGPLGRILSTRVACYLGEISYAIYLLHVLVMMAAVRALPHSWIEGSGTFVRVALFLCPILGVVGAAAIAHVLVERPSREWLRARIDRRWPPARSREA